MKTLDELAQESCAGAESTPLAPEPPPTPEPQPFYIGHGAGARPQGPHQIGPALAWPFSPASPPTGPPLPYLTWGARNIGKLINRTETDVYYLHRTGQLPTKNVAGRLVGRTDRLLAIAD